MPNLYRCFCFAQEDLLSNPQAVKPWSVEEVEQHQLLIRSQASPGVPLGSSHIHTSIAIPFHFRGQMPQYVQSIVTITTLWAEPDHDSFRQLIYFGHDGNLITALVWIRLVYTDSVNPHSFPFCGVPQMTKR